MEKNLIRALIKFDRPVAGVYQGRDVVQYGYSSGNIAVPVPDNTTVEVPITVPDGGSVADVNAIGRLFQSCVFERANVQQVRVHGQWK